MAARNALANRVLSNEVYTPEITVVARALDRLYSFLQAEGIVLDKRTRRRTALIGCAHYECHDIGMQLVATMWRIWGFSVVNLGSDVPSEDFAASATVHDPDLIGISSPMSTNLVAMADTVRTLQRPGASYRVLVGGSAVSTGFARDIGADGYAPDCVAAVDVALQLVRGRRR